MDSDMRSTLARADEIERDFFELKSQELGPAATKGEIQECIEVALELLIESRRLQ
jgi:hypothetical protein